MYCTWCGKEIADDSTFCPYCGNKQRARNNAGPPGGAAVSPTTARRHNLSAVEVIVSVAMPTVALVIAAVYIINVEKRSRGFAMLALALICAVLWSTLCLFLTGGPAYW